MSSVTAPFAKAHFETAAEAAAAAKATADEGNSVAAADGATSSESKRVASKEIPGRPVSGRVWKLQPKKFSSVRVGKAFHTSWEQKTEERNRKRSIKEREKALKAEADKEAEELKRRREQRKKQKLENERKSEVVQVIKNTAKIKRMSKKQLLTLRKR